MLSIRWMDGLTNDVPLVHSVNRIYLQEAQILMCSDSRGKHTLCVLLAEIGPIYIHLSREGGGNKTNGKHSQ